MNSDSNKIIFDSSEMIDRFVGLCKNLRSKIQNTDIDKKNEPILAYFKMSDILESYTEDMVLDNPDQFLKAWEIMSNWFKSHKISFFGLIDDTWYTATLRIIVTRSILDTIISEDYDHSEIDTASKYFIDAIIENLRRIYDMEGSLSNIELPDLIEDSGLWILLPTILRRNDVSFLRSVVKNGKDWLDENEVENNFSKILDRIEETNIEEILRTPLFMYFDSINPYNFKKYYNENPIEI